jgi:uncharacterized membrane protein
MDNYLFYLTFLAAVGSGIVAGVLFAFSAFVMKALMRIKAEQGIAAMQSINITVQSLLCSLLFFGTGLVSLFLLAISLLRWENPGAEYLLAGSLFYLFGGLLVTGAFNVPLNNKLAGVRPDNDEGHRFWNVFTAKWMIWNHVRTVACILTSVSYTAALLSF